MKVSVLVENTSISKDFLNEHGLSLYIETKKHKILFDTGASHLFNDNAQKLNIDIAHADIAVISHGHYDHGGGLMDFLFLNRKAKIYISPFAFSDYRSLKKDGQMQYIGLDINFAFNDRLHYVDNVYHINKNLMIFSGVTGDYPRPKGNDNLYVNADDGFVHDDFKHEQNLVIKEGKMVTLVAGCAHSGIVNIVEHCRALIGAYPNTVISGFHLYSPGTGKSEDEQMVRELATILLKTGATYYTGHCTGLQAYNTLRSVMGDKINNLSSGSQITIG